MSLGRSKIKTSRFTNIMTLHHLRTKTCLHTPCQQLQQKITGHFNSSSLKFRHRLPILLMFSQPGSIMSSWWLPSLSSWLAHKWIKLISTVTRCRRGSNDAQKRQILKSDKKPPRRCKGRCFSKTACHWNWLQRQAKTLTWRHRSTLGCLAVTAVLPFRPHQS